MNNMIDDIKSQLVSHLVIRAEKDRAGSLKELLDIFYDVALRVIDNIEENDME